MRSGLSTCRSCVMALKPLLFFVSLRCFASYRPQVASRGPVGNELITIMPPNEKHTATVIFMHGLGDSAAGWQDACYSLAKIFPKVKFILPTAPKARVTINMGQGMNAWYDITGLSERAAEECFGIEDSFRIVKALIDHEIDHGIHARNIVVGGFSQGGALSLYAGLQYNRAALGGILCMSGYLPSPKTFVFSKAQSRTPLLICHGEDDEVVPVTLASKTFDHLTAQRTSLLGSKPPLTLDKFKTYPDMYHQASNEELTDIAKWLQGIFKK